MDDCEGHQYVNIAHYSKEIPVDFNVNTVLKMSLSKPSSYGEWAHCIITGCAPV